MILINKYDINQTLFSHISVCLDRRAAAVVSVGDGRRRGGLWHAVAAVVVVVRGRVGRRAAAAAVKLVGSAW